MGSIPTPAAATTHESLRTASSPHAAAVYTDKYHKLLQKYRGRPIDVRFRELVGPLPADDLTHTIYPYPARLLRHIPKFMLGIEPIMNDIEYVLDPFCGSGTVLVEAQRQGRKAIGIDQNPIAALVSRVKTHPRDAGVLSESLYEILCAAKKTRARPPYPAYLDKWYNGPAVSVLQRLTAVRSSVDDHLAGDFLDLSIALLARRVSLADPRIPVPVRLKKPPDWTLDDIWQELELIGTQLIARIARLRFTDIPAVVITADCRSKQVWTDLALTSKTLVLTSPPYGPSQKYIRSCSLDAGWLGYAQDAGTIQLEANSIGREHIAVGNSPPIPRIPFSSKLKADLRNIKNYNHKRHQIFVHYFSDIANTFANIADQPAISTIVVVAGDNAVGGRQLATNAHIGAFIQAVGFTESLALKDPIGGRTLITRRHNGNVPTAAEYIRIYQR